MQDIAQIVEANWLAFALALLIGLLVAWWLWGRRSARLRTRHRAPDALDEGAAPAARNQALIDAPSAVTVALLADSGPDIFAGIGGAIAAGAAREVEAANPAPPPIAAPAPPLAPEPEPVAAPQTQPEPAPVAKPKSAPKAKAAPKPNAEPKPKPAAKPKPAPKAKAAPKPKPEPAPVAEAPPPPPAPMASGPDDLAQIKGLGPKLQALLPTLGVTTFAQIAAWDEAGIDAIDAQLGVFQGRIRKDNWVEQAKFLAGSDVAGYEAKFGKL